MPPRTQRGLAGLVAVALVTTLLLIGCKSREQAHSLYEEARRILRVEGDVVRAEQYFIKALKIDPTLTQAHMGLVHVYSNKYSNELYSESKTIHHLREVLRIAPEHIEAHYQLGVIAFDKEDFPVALREFETTHRLLRWPFGLEPGREWVELFTFEGFLLLERADLLRAEALFGRSRSLYPASYNSHLGLMLVAAGRGDEAAVERHAGEVARLAEPKDPVAYEGLMHIWTGRAERAIVTLEKEIARMGLIDRERPPRRYVRYQKYLAWAYWKAGRVADAQALVPGRQDDLAPSPLELLSLLQKKE